MGPGNFMFGGWWIIPIVMCIIMMVFFLMSGRRGFRPPWMQGSDKNHPEGKDSETPLDILKRRYAKGEITKDEFEEMKRHL